MSSPTTAQTKPIRLTISIGDPSSSTIPCPSRTFIETAPLSLEPATYTQAAFQAWFARVVDKYNPLILSSGAWKCVECGAPAGGLVHQVMAFQEVFASAEPELSDFVTTVCIYGGRCHAAQQARMQQKLIDVGMPLAELRHACEVCRATEGIKVCNGCKAVGYCGLEHQKLHWKIHKHRCNHAAVGKKTATPAASGEGQNENMTAKPTAAASAA